MVWACRLDYNLVTCVQTYYPEVFWAAIIGSNIFAITFCGLLLITKLRRRSAPAGGASGADRTTPILRSRPTFD